MGGDEHLRPQRDQLLQGGGGDGRAFAGIGVRGDLVDEHQRAGTCRFEDVLEGRQVRGEGGQIPRQVSFVPDRRVHGPVERHARAGRGRDGQAGARHERAQPHRRDGDRLSARVGAAHDQRPRRSRQRHVVGHHRGRAQRQKRMAHREDPEALLRGIEQLGRRGAQIVGEPGRSAGLVQHRERGHVLIELWRAPAHRARQLGEDALLLFQRARFGDGELVPQLDELLGLDEQRLPAAGRVVDDAGQVRLVLGAQGHHVAIAAHRVVRVAEHARHVGIGEHLFEPGLDAAVQAARAIAQLGEQRARGVEQLAGRIEGAFQLGGERLEVREGLPALRVERRRLPHLLAEPAHGRRRAHQPRDRQQLLGLQRPFASGPAQRRP